MIGERRGISTTSGVYVGFRGGFWDSQEEYGRGFWGEKEALRKGEKG